MRLDDQRASSNVEDRRGIGMVGGGLGVGGIVIAATHQALGIEGSTELRLGSAEPAVDRND